MQFPKLFVAVLAVAGMVGPSFAGDSPSLKVEQTTFEVGIDQTRTLDQLIAVGKYDWVSPDLTKYFTIAPGADYIVTLLTLLNFNQEMTSEQVLVEMDRLGLRPATLQELLSLGAQRPELQKEFPVIALGTVVRVSGDRRVAFLYRGDRERYLYLFWFAGQWCEYCRFAAVRK